MAKLIIALLSSQAVPVVLGLEFQGLEFNTVDEVVAFANDIGTKSSVEEQAVLKTLLNERGQWHPEATSLFQDVVKRPSSRRLASLGSRKVCNGATETECKSMVDKQCSTCNWDYSCKANECDSYKTEADCCANAMKVATGCVYNKDQSKCMPKVCGAADKFTGKMVMGSPTDADVTAANAACKAQPGCTSVCDSENAAAAAAGGVMTQKHGFCVPGSDGDYTCTENSMSKVKEPKRVKNGAASMSSDQAMTGLMSALGASPCNLMQCSACLKMDNCDSMKTNAAAGGKCNDKCKALAQTPSEVECLFCGQKAAGCTPEQATPFASCGTVALTDVVKPAAADNSCTGACAAAKATCPSTDGAEMNCFEVVPVGAARQTAAMVGLLAPVLAYLMM